MEFYSSTVNLNLKKINTYFSELSLLKLMIWAIVANLQISVFFNLIACLFFNNSLNDNVNEFASTKEEFIAVVIIAPVFETLLFQYSLIELFIKKTNKLYACLISSLIFALFHLYNLYYFLFAIFTGLIFAYLYITCRKRNRAIILTMVCHSLYNLIIFFLKRI